MTIPQAPVAPPSALLALTELPRALAKLSSLGIAAPFLARDPRGDGPEGQPGRLEPLGGVMARQLARRAPEAVRQVISLGSPFTGTPKATNVWRAHEVRTGQKIDDADVTEQMRESAETDNMGRMAAIAGSA